MRALVVKARAAASAGGGGSERWRRRQRGLPPPPTLLRSYEVERLTDGQHYALKVTELSALPPLDKAAVVEEIRWAAGGGAPPLGLAARRGRLAAAWQAAAEAWRGGASGRRAGCRL